MTIYSRWGHFVTRDHPSLGPARPKGTFTVNSLCFCWLVLEKKNKFRVPRSCPPFEAYFSRFAICNPGSKHSSSLENGEHKAIPDYVSRLLPTGSARPQPLSTLSSYLLLSLLPLRCVAALRARAAYLLHDIYAYKRMCTCCES